MSIKSNRTSQLRTMSHTEVASEVSRSIALRSDDIKHFRQSATSLPGGWDVKVVPTGMTKYRSNAVYFFRTCPVTDASPTIVVIRNAHAYLVITHDVLTWLHESAAEALICSKLSEASEAIHRLICEIVEADGDSGLTWDYVPAARDGMGRPSIADRPAAGAFFPILGSPT